MALPPRDPDSLPAGLEHMRRQALDLSTIATRVTAVERQVVPSWSASTSGQVLTSNGFGVGPTWQTAALDGVSGWSTIWLTGNSIAAATGNNAYTPTFAGLLASPANLYTAGRTPMMGPWTFRASHYAAPTGKSLQLRLLAQVTTNATPLTAASTGIVFGLGSISAIAGAAGAVTVTFARIGGTEVATGVGSAGSTLDYATGNIVASLADGVSYLPTVTTSDTSGATPAAYSSVFTMALQYRHA